ncbi:hypothetical protein B0H14DRAFT_3503990 [Mycena olivaceomarginata]|nr:hypothetical protein B0H14DRAFT_3503990 [Mycena olivaceomarginata]
MQQYNGPRDVVAAGSSTYRLEFASPGVPPNHIRVEATTAPRPIPTPGSHNRLAHNTSTPGHTTCRTGASSPAPAVPAAGTGSTAAIAADARVAACGAGVYVSLGADAAAWCSTPPDTAAVAGSDTREELESGGWKGRLLEVLSVSFRVRAGSSEERQGWIVFAWDEMWIRRARHCRCRCWYRWEAAGSVRRDWTGCEMRRCAHIRIRTVSTALQPGAFASLAFLFISLYGHPFRPHRIPVVLLQSGYGVNVGWGAFGFGFGFGAPNILPRPLPPPSPHGMGMAKSLRPPRHPPPRPRRRPTPTPDPYAPASSSSSALPPSSPSAPTSHSDGWAIWSRRPRDPAHAPGVIISPRARAAAERRGVCQGGGDATAVAAAGAGRVEERTEEAVAQPEAPDAADADADADTPSSSTDYTDTRTTGTPVTTATTVPGSPLSAAEPAAAPAASTSTSPDAAEPRPAAPAAPPNQKNRGPPSFDPPPQAPKPENKKLGGLPTSSVVGFSIPAAGAGSGAAESVRKNHAALRALLSAPAADATAAAPKSFAGASSASAAPTASETPREERLTPRGFVNTGNILFARLHALLGEAEFDVAGTGAGGFNTNPSGGQDDGGGGGRGAGGRRRSYARRGRSCASLSLGKVSPAEEQEEEPEAFIPTHIYDALKGKKRFDGMWGGHQEDAEEFLGFFLDTLEEEFADGTEREEEAPPETEDGWLEVGRKNRTVVTRTVGQIGRITPITRIFGGRFRSTLRAPGQKDSVIVDDWRSLRLDIQRDGIHTMADALALISHPQTVQMSHPSRPGIVVDASQQILIDALPPILILHVKRFCYDTAVGGVVKVGKRVAFGPELKVGNDVLVPTARKQPVRYKLFGVVYHHGVSVSGGHYTLDCRGTAWGGARATGTGSEHEGWVRINDELVSDVWPVDVFGVPEGDSRCAYLLFYRRVR